MSLTIQELRDIRECVAIRVDQVNPNLRIEMEIAKGALAALDREIRERSAQILHDAEVYGVGS